MKKQVILLLLTAGICLSATAQFNDSTHNFMQYALTGIINKTNTSRSFLITNALQYKLRMKKRTLNFSAGHVYGEQQNLVSNNDFRSVLDFNLYPKDSSKLYYWGLLNFEKSYSLNINYRMQSGLGLAYNFFDNANQFLNLSNGILYETSSIKRNNTTNEQFDILRNSFRLRYRFGIGKVIVVEGTNLLQNSLNDKHDYILNLANSVNLKLRSWLLFRTAFTFNRNNLTGRENMLITLGLTAERYF